MEAEKYLFINNQFLPIALQDEFEKNGVWDPKQGVFVAEDEFITYTRPDSERILATDANGYPVWVDRPPLTHEEEVKAAERKLQGLLAIADATTSDWRTELALGIITDVDKNKLMSWMLYVKSLKSIDIQSAPLIDWPESPDQ